ncbi:hypothetical protein [Thermomonas sp.]|uniref:hypothetical protein n=1 Tax=Thermomonas sp. TaxID=1971895 RepID=UPI002620F065|nr:hypothetical protein [Thermomonas sp.]
MNAILDSAGNGATQPAPHSTHPTAKLKLLLKREYWEHKGGFFWAPIWAAGISLLFTLLGLITAEFAARKASFGNFKINGEVMVNGLDLNAITAQMSSGDMEKLAAGISMSAASAMIWPLLALGFVVFFYCLASLYDERQTRSVLFWKSLPISDRDTVLSKAISALIVAPVIATAIGIVCMLAFLLILSVFVLIHHGNPFTLLWNPSSLLANASVLVAALPIYALWALPSVGWLMLCSVWAKSKPFLWAVALPVFAGVFISWFDLLSIFNIESNWFWKNIVAHLLGGVFPGTWMQLADLSSFNGNGIPSTLTIVQGMYTVLLSPQLWIGAAAGVAMLIGAMQLRRWRDEG